MEALQLDLNAYQPRNPKVDDLHKIIRENYRQVFYDKELQGVTLPFHLQREFQKYLQCGVLAHGFARFHCSHCQKDKLVAYSCKGRGICPSCTGRRMADTAKHLITEVIPAVPVRQWVLSMPYVHRFELSRNKKLLSSVMGIYHRAIAGFYTREAKRLGLHRPKVGAILIIQRFGGALNLNVHFHSLYMDGVYFENSFGEQVFKEIIPKDEDISRLVKSIKTRINRAFTKRGLLGTDLLEERECIEDENTQLSLLRAESVQNKVDIYNRPESIGKYTASSFEQYLGKRCSSIGGFSLHANVKILAHQRSGLERLARYVARGGVAKERISLSEDGGVYLKLKHSYNDGTTHLRFTPEQFIKRLIALIPPPRQNFIRYYGVFGARHRNRHEITSKTKMAKALKQNKEKKKIKYRTPWAELMKRVFEYEVLYCDHCGNQLKFIAAITTISTCQQILNHLNLDTEVVCGDSPRGPPENISVDYDIDQNSYNQESNW